jgi:photosystem II stability/assembly factor-like uncharacterized protein
MKKTLLLSWFLCTISLAFAQQDWKTMMHRGYTLPQIKAAMQTQLAGEPTPIEKAEKGEHEDGNTQYRRWEEHWQHRVMPDGSFPTARFMEKNWQQYSEAFGGVQNRNGSGNWQFYGPGSLPQTTTEFYPGKGRVNALDIHPTNPNELLVGAASSGIWKSTDKGQTWASKTDNLPTLGISDIVRDPANPLILYAATGDSDAERHPGTGIIKSIDGGETWQMVGFQHILSENFITCRLAAVSANTILATTFYGIFRSSDGGVTWAQTAADTVSAYCIVAKPGNPNVFYTGSFDGRALRSTDAGMTWSELTLPVELAGDGRIELAVTPANPEYIFALSRNGNLASSSDGGNTWTTFANAPADFSSQRGYNQTVAISPLTTNKIIIGGVHGYRTLDGGATWEKYLDGYWETGNPNFYVHSDHHVMKFLPGTEILFTGNDGGLSYGDINGTVPFTDVSSKLNITQYYGLGLINTDTTVLIAGAQDNDAVFFKNGTAYGILPGNDGYDGMIDFNNPNIAYACATGGFFIKTTDGWQTYKDADSFPTLKFKSDWDVQMKMNPLNSSAIYLGGRTIERSLDKGETWTKFFDAFDEVNGMDISRADTNIWYVNTALFGLWNTKDNGATWNLLTLPPDFTPDQVTDLMIHPTDPLTVVLTIGGFVEGQKIWKTSDGGVTWKNISANLPNIPVNCVLFAAGTPTEEIYLGTDLGIMHLVGPDTSWQTFNTGLPFIPVSELQINYLNGSMYAATYGRGVWKTPVANLPVAVGEPVGHFTEPAKIRPTLSQDGRFQVVFPENSGTEPFNLRVFNAVGGVVLSQKVSGENPQTIQLSGGTAGVYFVQIQRGSFSQLEKIIIAK